jgi:hypothetical protein
MQETTCAKNKIKALIAIPAPASHLKIISFKHLNPTNFKLKIYFA